MDNRLLLAAEQAVSAAMRAGATAADSLVLETQSLSVDVRHGAVESTERSESCALSVRAFVGKQMALVSLSNMNDVVDAAQRAVELARVTPPDELSSLADSALLCQHPQLPDCYDPAPEPTPQQLTQRAQQAEAAALAHPLITNSEGASASYGVARSAYVTSHGFAGAYQRTSSSMSCTAVAGTGTQMERDYGYAVACYGADLPTPASVGLEAATRTVQRLTPQKPASGQYNIVFDNRASSELLGMLADALNGDTWARGSSFLREHLHKPVFAPHVQVFDDPCLPRGLASRAFDAEGLAATPLQVIENGVLAHRLLDTTSARKLGTVSNGRASRSVRGNPRPSTSNFYMAAGDLSLSELLHQVGDGLLITETIGDGLNSLTGDYSVGASGRRIVRGVLSESLSEFTIAGNIRDLFAALVPANDLVFRSSCNAPSVWVGKMMVASSG